MEIEIDYSGIPQAPSTAPSAWRPPRHVFFGKKGADGIMEDEPVYVHQSFPCMLYKMRGETVTACIVQDADQLAQRTADGWADSPAKFGIVTAPTFDQVAAMEAQADLEAEQATLQPEVAAEPVKRGPGRPRKDE